MRTIADFEFPDEELAVLRKAVWLEIGTLFYVLASAGLVFLVMGSSQGARAAFFEDLISLVPAAAFLIASRVRKLKPSHKHPYGWGGAVSVGYLAASLALAAMGAFLVYEAASKALGGEQTTIGGFALGDTVVWGGWPMITVLVLTAAGSILLGRAKLKLAPKVHDKVLFADAKMMQADWTSALASCFGILGVGMGWWWLDIVAGGLIGLDILHDGLKNTTIAVEDLIERRPMKTDGSAPEEAPTVLRDFALGLDWVEEAEVRVREVGHVFFGEVFVRPKDQIDDLPRRVGQAMAQARALDWRFHDVTFIPLDDLERNDGGLRDGRGEA